MKKEELVIGEVYTCDNEKYIVKWGQPNYYIGSTGKRSGLSRGFIDYLYEYKVATPQEKEWLLACIAANKFIPLEEVERGDVPEYVECINSCSLYFTKGKVYKINKSDSTPTYCRVLKDDAGTPNGWHSSQFRPSTKEAYDAQQPVTVDNLVKGEVYILKSGVDWIFKFDRCEGDQMIGAFARLDGSNLHKESDLSKSFVKSIRKATPEERALLNPKIVESKPEEKPMEKFKKGDYVELLISAFGYEKGDIGIIVEGTNHVNVPNRTSKSCYKPNVHFLDNEMKLSSEEAYKRQYSIGQQESNLDKAKRMYGNGVKFYSAASRKQCTSHGNISEDYDGIYMDGNYVFYKDKWAEIITEAPKEEEEEKWKIGGWVRLTEPYGGNSKGAIGRIKEHSYNTKTTVCVALPYQYISFKEDYCQIKKQNLEWLGMNHPGGVPSSVKIDEEILFNPSRWMNTDPIEVYPGAGAKKNVDALPHQKVHFLTKKKSKKSILI